MVVADYRTMLAVEIASVFVLRVGFEGGTVLEPIPVGYLSRAP